MMITTVGSKKHGGGGWVWTQVSGCSQERILVWPREGGDIFTSVK